ncbi:hypothetical protein NPA08_01010 [Mycoplasmopsis citelli]|uniref:Lipoprotein n=1 Tax=Mycoplasmopsis citelli TaxID=171281 RepID=A0A449B354_9BACT|nr:hypothetical protein [Mycoplasmopsis citelli]UUD36403.1 hypothetical protein NPA08_01010 [Mycoplasmopsis citelli]VEU75012.1 Uncharacterised protein [Mycoplasmopsis citelli]
MKKFKKLLKILLPLSTITLSGLSVISCDNLFQKNFFRDSVIEFQNFVKEVERKSSLSKENSQKLEFMLISLHNSENIYQNILHQIEINSSTALNPVSQQKQQMLSAQIQSLLSVGRELLKKLLDNSLKYDSLEAITPYLLLDTESKQNFLGITSAKEELNKYSSDLLKEPKYNQLNDAQDHYSDQLNNFFNNVALSFFQTKILNQVFTFQDYEHLQREINNQQEMYLKLVDKINKNEVISNQEIEEIKNSSFVKEFQPKLDEYIKINKK